MTCFSNDPNTQNTSPLSGSEDFLYHVCSIQDWQKASPNTYHQQGPFTHLSTAKELDLSIRLHLSSFKNLILLCLKTEHLGHGLRWENTSSRQTLMPHLYAPLPNQAIEWIILLPNEPNEHGSRCPSLATLKTGVCPQDRKRFPLYTA